MSDLEVLSVASSIIPIVDAVSKVISACQDNYGLPDAIRSSVYRLGQPAKRAVSVMILLNPTWAILPRTNYI
ncbi:hypothetical protein GE21DRAFT_1014719 [Neurospora crassa]|nr:hypothetical protein GE21DRAFT_1014719 [Neurospora crassa]